MFFIVLTVFKFKIMFFITKKITHVSHIYNSVKEYFCQINCGAKIRELLCLLILIMTLIACEDKKEEKVIPDFSEEKMIAILKDVHLAEASVQSERIETKDSFLYQKIIEALTIDEAKYSKGKAPQEPIERPAPEIPKNIQQKMQGEYKSQKEKLESIRKNRRQ